MYKTLRGGALPLLLICTLLTGCWSSKEIEEKSVYVGMAVDIAREDEFEKHLERKDDTYSSRNNVTATIQIVPQKSFASNKENAGPQENKYLNLQKTGESMFEIMRQYSLRRDRIIIGHHLKVYVISRELAEQVEIDKLLDFMLRDNDIRPNCMVFLSRGKAADTLISSQPNEIPAFHIRDMVSNRARNNKVMKEVILTNLDQYIQSKQSFVLQLVSSYKGEIEFTGAGIIKGETGKWIGDLNQDDVSSIAWIKGEAEGGFITALNLNNEMVTYEIKSAKSKITPKIEGSKISFQVDIQSDGRLIENWDVSRSSSKQSFLQEVEQATQQKLESMLQSLMKKLQQQYKADVVGFGKRLSITNPQLWKKVKEDWDEVFSRSEVTFNVKLNITDFGSSTE